MEEEKRLKNEVLTFIKDKIGLKNIDENTNVGSKEYEIFDLDAEFFMLRFFEEFKINYVNFEITSFFYYPNYSWKNIVFIRKFFNKKNRMDLQPLTIDHLIKVAEKKQWFDPS